jgi:4-coumarate--CoA ligase
MVFKSSESPIAGIILCPITTQQTTNIEKVAENETIWSWLFDSERPILKMPTNTNGFRDADSGEGISYEHLKSYSASLSTTFVDYYHVKPGHRIVILCGNSIWYPVVMFAGLRIGKFSI